MFTYLRFWLASKVRDERGVTVIEYALMLFMVALAVVATLQPIRSAVISIFQAVQSALSAAAAG
jgi:Flp pilus assembly pilin Flp